MPTSLIEYSIVAVLAFSIIAVVIGGLFYCRDSERTAKAVPQAMRWFAAGAVFAAVGNTLSEGPNAESILVATLALVALIGLEYLIMGTEDFIAREKREDGDGYKFAS